MTVEEALQMIDTVCAQVQLNRQGHIQLQTAIEVIRSAVMDDGKTASSEEDKQDEPAK